MWRLTAALFPRHLPAEYREQAPEASTALKGPILELTAAAGLQARACTQRRRCGHRRAPLAWPPQPLGMAGLHCCTPACLALTPLSPRSCRLPPQPPAAQDDCPFDPSAAEPRVLAAEDADALSDEAFAEYASRLYLYLQVGWVQGGLGQDCRVGARGWDAERIGPCWPLLAEVASHS